MKNINIIGNNVKQYSVILGDEKVFYRKGKHKIGQWVLIAFPSVTHPFIKYFISDELDLQITKELDYKAPILMKMT